MVKRSNYMKIEKLNRKFNPDIDSNDYEPLTENEIAFGEALFNFLQELINADDYINEEFISKEAIKNHYKHHCTGAFENRKSKRTNVYYDFKNIDKYRIYENNISDKILSSTNVIYSLNDDNMYKFFRKLFEGNFSIYFKPCCGFRNNKGTISIGFNSFASNVTRNYINNTINFLVFGGNNNNTITMYPIDANYVERKFNNLIKTYHPENLVFKFNND